MRETGYVVGDTIVIEYRWANGDYERLRDQFGGCTETAQAASGVEFVIAGSL